MAETLQALQALVPEKRESLNMPLKPSAVLVLLFEKDNDLHILLTKRPDSLKTHGGQVAFPGGGMEENEDAVQCALRETEEEVGISREKIKVLGLLDDVETISFYQVTPVLGLMKELPELKLQPQEVEKAFSVPFPLFMHEEKWTKDRSKTFLGKPYPVYYFHGSEEIIWGVTARIIRRLVRKYKDTLLVNK